jgi:hypothetical protein
VRYTRNIWAQGRGRQLARKVTTSLQSDREQNGASALTDAPRDAMRRFSVAEIAILWILNEDYVRLIFEKEPGVLLLEGAKPSRLKRPYQTLRLPASPRPGR